MTNFFMTNFFMTNFFMTNFFMTTPLPHIKMYHTLKCPTSFFVGALTPTGPTGLATCSCKQPVTGSADKTVDSILDTDVKIAI